MDNGVDVGRVFGVADAAGKITVGGAEVLQQGFDVGRPGVGAFVDAEDVVTPFLQGEAEVCADLAAGTGDEDTHGELL